MPGCGGEVGYGAPSEEAFNGQLTPTRKLLKDIIDAGGILEIGTRDDKTSYRRDGGSRTDRAGARGGVDVAD